jgi:hypothetical protein
VLTRAAARELLPQVRNTGWFFDTEMLLLARSAQLRVQEIGVVWVDDRDSRVKVLATVCEMALGLVRLRAVLWARYTHQCVRFLCQRMRGFGRAGAGVAEWLHRVCARKHALLLLSRRARKLGAQFTSFTGTKSENTDAEGAASDMAAPPRRKQVDDVACGYAAG